MNYIVIPADVSESLKIVDVPENREAFNKVRELISDGYVQLTQVSGYKKLQMCVDEDGQMKQLPFNLRASLVAGIGQQIVGDAVVTAKHFKGVEKAHPELMPLIEAWGRM